jgi:hypothetical protein
METPKGEVIMLELKDLPPSIQEALKRKGWTYPFTEEMKQKMGEALARFAGSGHLDPETIDEVWRERRGHDFHRDGHRKENDGC